MVLITIIDQETTHRKLIDEKDKEIVNLKRKYEGILLY